jgi:hypothetical protein
MAKTAINLDDLTGDAQSNPAPESTSDKSVISPRQTMSDDLFVTDTTATVDSPTRVHEHIVAGKREKFTFGYATPVKLPRAVAMKFAKTESFIVEDADGNRVQPIVTQPFINGVKSVDLALDQCIANFSELTDEALLIRCQQSNGGEVITRDNSRSQRIEFLVATRLKFEESLKVAKQRPQAADGVMSDGEYEGGISKDVLDRMLGGLGKEMSQIATH